MFSKISSIYSRQKTVLEKRLPEDHDEKRSSMWPSQIHQHPAIYSKEIKMSE
jgi:hypothetical protein